MRCAINSVLFITAILCCLLAGFDGRLTDAQPRASRRASPAASRQLIVVTTTDWSSVDGRLQRYQRETVGAPWRSVGSTVPVVVGKAGMGWGVGAIEDPAVQDAAEPVKREGDHRSPAGVFGFGEAFGYASYPPGSWKIRYLPLTASTDCVDDPQSRHYNRILDRSSVPVDWKSAERMRDAGKAYRWGIVIDYNTASPRPNAGSCVFMHIWGGPGAGTEGCTAMAQMQLRAVLAWMDPADRPVLVQMPVAQYRRVQHAWKLPPAPQ